MSGHAAFIAAIIENPHDETAAKVFADFLTDHNEPGLAAVLARLDELILSRLRQKLTLAANEQTGTRQLGWDVHVVWDGWIVASVELRLK